MLCPCQIRKVFLILELPSIAGCTGAYSFELFYSGWFSFVTELFPSLVSRLARFSGGTRSVSMGAKTRSGENLGPIQVRLNPARAGQLPLTFERKMILYKLEVFNLGN